MTAMNEMNSILASAFDPYKSIFDNVLAVMSLYISTWLFSSHYDRVRLFRPHVRSEHALMVRTGDQAV